MAGTIGATIRSDEFSHRTGLAGFAATGAVTAAIPAATAPPPGGDRRLESRDHLGAVLGEGEGRTRLLDRSSSAYASNQFRALQWEAGLLNGAPGEGSWHDGGPQQRLRHVMARGLSASSGTDSALITPNDVASGGVTVFRVQSARTRIRLPDMADRW